MSTAPLVDLFEQTLSAPGEPLKVDREKGVIYGTKILGERSLNPPPFNNDYPKGTREAAVPLLEGGRSYVDHVIPGDDKPARRSYRDSIGVHRNVRESGSGLVSDFHFNPKHALAEQLCWDAEHAPENVGFSIATKGRRAQQPDGRWVVEEIVFDRNHHSIDLVSRGATTSSLYEALMRNQPMTTPAAPAPAAQAPPAKAKKKHNVRLLLEGLFRAKPAKLSLLREMADMGAMPADAEMETEEAPVGGESPEEAPDADAALAAGFRAAVIKVLDDKGLDTKAKVKKIGEILKMEEKMLTKEDVSAGDAEESLRRPPAPAGTTDLTESARLRLQLKARDKCAIAKVVPTRLQLKALDACATEAEIDECVEELRAEAARAATPAATPAAPPPAGGTPGARSSAPGTTTINESLLPKCFAEKSDEARKQRVAFLRGAGTR